MNLASTLAAFVAGALATGVPSPDIFKDERLRGLEILEGLRRMVVEVGVNDDDQSREIREGEAITEDIVKSLSKKIVGDSFKVFGRWRYRKRGELKQLPFDVLQVLLEYVDEEGGFPRYDTKFYENALWKLAKYYWHEDALMLKEGLAWLFVIVLRSVGGLEEFRRSNCFISGFIVRSMLDWRGYDVRREALLDALHRELGRVFEMMAESIFIAIYNRIAYHNSDVGLLVHFMGEMIRRFPKDFVAFQLHSGVDMQVFREIFTKATDKGEETVGEVRMLIKTIGDKHGNMDFITIAPRRSMNFNLRGPRGLKKGDDDDKQNNRQSLLTRFFENCRELANKISVRDKTTMCEELSPETPGEEDGVGMMDTEMSLVELEKGVFKGMSLL